MKRFDLRLDDSLHKALKREAFDKNISLNEIISDILRKRSKCLSEVKQEMLEHLDHYCHNMGHDDYPSMTDEEKQETGKLYDIVFHRTKEQIERLNHMSEVSTILWYQLMEREFELLKSKDKMVEWIKI